MSKWIQPFGLSRDVLFDEDGHLDAELELVFLAVAAILDLLSLPLALLRVLGIGDGSSGDS